MSALAMMFFQDPRCFRFSGAWRIPAVRQPQSPVCRGSDPQDSCLRESLDAVETAAINPALGILLQRLQRGNQLGAFRFLNGYYLVALDGSQYFSSKDPLSELSDLQRLQGRCATRTRFASRHTQSAHAPSPAASPGADCQYRWKEKQDCELSAPNGFYPKSAAPTRGCPLLSRDGLYSDQPFVDTLKKGRMSFILVAKPADHKILFEWVQELTAWGRPAVRTHRCQGPPAHLPLAQPGAAQWQQRCRSGQLLRVLASGGSKNHLSQQLVTDLAVTRDNVVELVQGGRARWKIENETFNTLKNQGYHIEHNFGHGSQHLSLNFFVLNLLAFYIHQILELCDLSYQYCVAASAAARVLEQSAGRQPVAAF